MSTPTAPGTGTDDATGGGPDGTVTVAPDGARVEVLACDPPHALELTWSFPGEATSHVHAQLDADGDGTVLTLVHTELQESAARGYGGGWHRLLDLLDDHVAGRPVRTWDELFDDRVARYRA